MEFRKLIFPGLCLVAAVLFTGLGLWQLERRIWKLDLIDRVNHRVHADVVAAPESQSWPGINANDDTYRHVKVRGVFLHDKETLVQAVTERGPGFWVMTPLRADAGYIVMINRGFVPTDHRNVETRKAGQVSGRVTITGLMRMSEPKGGFLRDNNPGSGFWYSRDVAAIAVAHDLKDTAPYFIDADAVAIPGNLPIGGMTIVTFHNNHLVYALTWFSLGFLSMLGFVFALRLKRR